ncbi:Endocytosis regulator [Lecanora helva]
MPMPTGVRNAALKTSKSHRTYPDNNRTSPDNNSIEYSGGQLERKDSSARKPSIAVMDLFKKDHNKEKRNSLTHGLGIGRGSSPSNSSPKGSPKLKPAKPAKLAVEMESPPLVFYGSTTRSSGALMSGSLLLTVTEPSIVLETFEMQLIARVKFKKPVNKDCPACTTKDTVLFTWKFLTESRSFNHDIHAFPFSYLIPGHIPTTSRCALGSVDYILDAKAVTSTSDSIAVTRPLTIQRALPPTGDKTSVRIFPPTNLSVRVVLPSVIYPIGEIPVAMSLTGVVDNKLKNIERRWRIRRMNWRLEEVSKTISAACPKHAHKIGGEGKGVMHEDFRTLAMDDLKSGWKNDFDTEGGSIDCEWIISMKPNMNACCDVVSPTGFEVSHSLVLEIIVSEEQTTGGGKDRAAPTGSARVLRMQFKVVLTERSGMGISWDEEMPPMYEDVPKSPPGYIKVEDFEGDLGPDEELERMREDPR